MSGLLNIFSEKKLKIIEKPKVIADYREKNSLVIAELISLGINVEVKELKVADYITKDTAIERKTVSDFLSSMLNRRLIGQLESLQQYKNKLLLIEGTTEQELYHDRPEGINGNAIRGFLLSILLKYNVPIIFTKDAEDTAKFIAVLAKKKEKEHPLNAKRKSLNKKEQVQFILESFPGIGPTTAKKLLKEFKTLNKIFNAEEDSLKKCIGKKADIFKIIEEKY